MHYDGILAAVALAALVTMLGCSKTLQPDGTLEARATAMPSSNSSGSAPAIVSNQVIPEPTPPIEGQATCSEGSDLTEFGPITSTLGYALGPAKLPEGFINPRVGFSGGLAQVSYDKAGRQLIIVAYPVTLALEDSQQIQGPGLVRPKDAIDEAQVGGETAHFMRGGWSDATIMAGPGIDPASAVWDYEKSLGIFFDCVTPVGTAITVAVQARPGPVTWISDEEMIGIAESIALRE